MTISIAIIAAALREEDVEGLIASGAPSDEYSLEAEKIASALTALDGNRLNAATVVAVISFVWAKAFNRSPEEIKERIPAFQVIAQKLLAA